MAENNQKHKQKSPLIGVQAQATTLDKTTKLDIDTKNVLIDDIIEAGLGGGLNTGALNEFTTISNARDQIYQLIDTMAADSAVASILRTYSEEVCEASDSGHIIWCESTDPKISKFVNYLLNTMNVDKNIYRWIYCLLKYGDVYLRLFRESDYTDKLFKKDHVNNAALSMSRSLREDMQDEQELNEAVRLNRHSVADKYSLYLEMVPDPGTMFELTKYGRTYGYVETPNAELTASYLTNYLGQTADGNFTTNYRMKSGDVTIHQADDFVHACLDDNFTRYPEKIELFLTEADYTEGINAQGYTVRRGKSLLYDSYKIWREKALLENAALLNRITRSSVIRNIQIEVGDMPKAKAQETLRRFKDLFEQKSAFDVGNSMSEYNSPGPIENNIYTTTHGGQGAVSVNAIGGDVEVKNLADLDWWNNKFYAAFGIPKQYFGWTDDGAGFNGGTSLSILSSVFAKGVKSVQNAMIQALTDAINLILINRGCSAYLNNFTLKMRAPITQEEIDYRTDLTNRISAISNAQSLFADIEDKGRRLNILKELFATLNYGDNINNIIEEEIIAVKEAARKAAEEEAASLESSDESGADLESMTTDSGESGESDLDLDLDLGNSSAAPVGENFNKNEDAVVLNEEAVTNFLTEDEDLPTPAELNSHKDFAENI